MGMPVIIEVSAQNVHEEDFEEVLSYFQDIDERFSPYKDTSEVMGINASSIHPDQYSNQMREILQLSEDTKKETNGFFDVYHNGSFDPSGIVKGYAISRAAKMLSKKGFNDFYVSIAGDIQTYGKNDGEKWRVGIENPFNREEIIKVVYLSGEGIATSGAYIRGAHIYNPVANSAVEDVKSISVIARDVFDADRFATAAFAMGKKGIEYIESKNGLEGCMVTDDQKIIMTSGFGMYLIY